MATQLINLIVDLSKKGEPIALKEAVRLIKNYKDCDGWGNNKTRAVWFSTADLNAISQLSQRELNWDGMRVYFAKYAPAEVPHPNRQTLVFMPTRVQIINGVISHVNIFDLPTEIGKLDTDPPGPDDPDAYNHGELEP